MIDGYEYWFTSWDLENNRWSMNPLIDSDQWLDSDMDSVDCNRDGNISLMNNLPTNASMNPEFMANTARDLAQVQALLDLVTTQSMHISRKVIPKLKQDEPYSTRLVVKTRCLHQE